MRVLLAILRAFLTISILLTGTFLLVVASLFPVSIKQAPLAAWAAVYMARAFCVVFNVYVRPHDVHRLADHAGFIFPNHLSYLDIIALVHIVPVRFLSAAEVLGYPVIGWVASKIGTVFVRRDDRSSRQQAREDIGAALQRSTRPPIVLFPEGRLGTGDKLFPFRHGAFAIAVENEVAFLPCALHYSDPEIVFWRGIDGESLLPAVIRLATFPGPTYVDVYCLSPVQTKLDDDPAQLAAATEAMIAPLATHEVQPREPIPKT